MTLTPTERTAADKTLARGVAVYRLLNQSEVWVDRAGQHHPVATLDRAYARAIVRFLERRATAYARLYDWGECQDPIMHLDVSEHIEDDFARWSDEREHNPLAWLRTTVLYQALHARARHFDPAGVL